ncbi:MAG TPA: Rne/Rng family ribonuclease [Bacteroidales bacterium]|nr:Rne/Rng family ribonuclease [Bacteroidales bacterium]
MEKQTDLLRNELYIDVRPSDITFALLENKQLVELNREVNNMRFSVGDIYLGKVKRIMPGLNAAFVDVGYEKDAFLHYLDLGPQFLTFNKFLQLALQKKQRRIHMQAIENEPDINKNGKIGDILNVGQFVMVQIAKEPISSKGPRLSAEISIAGRNLVLMPFSDRISVSQKIKSNEEKKRLKQLIQSITPQNYGVIVRTIAETKKVATLDKELKNLAARWESIINKLAGTKPPSLLIGEDDRATVILRDMLNASFHQIVVNDQATYEEIKSFITEIAPEKQKIVKLYTDKPPIFDHFGIEKQIKTLFGKTVPLKNGSYLIIEHTEAAHIIDVNSGNRYNSEQNQEANVTEVNLMAAEEIARQLRLRDMGGIIVIDFIDMHDNQNKLKVLEKMKQCMADDRAKFHVLPLSKFCLMEITRQRVRPEMFIKTAEACPTCSGTGKIGASALLVDEIENSLKYILKKYTFKKITIKTHPFVEAYFNKGWSTLTKKWRKQYKQKLVVLPMQEYTYMEYHFFNELDEEIIY